MKDESEFIVVLIPSDPHTANDNFPSLSQAAIEDMLKHLRVGETLLAKRVL